MNKLLIASLLSLSSIAFADKAVPVFAEQIIPEGHDGGDATTTLTLLPDGTIERSDRKAGAETHATGRLDAKQVAAIKAELAAPSWKVLHQDIHCMAIGATFTRYSVGGKAVYDQHVCGDSLDADSAKALAHVRAIVETAVPTSTPPPAPVPHPAGLPPPPCTRSGGVLWEQEAKYEPHVTMNVNTSGTTKITVYEGGTWERVDRDASGRNPKLSSGCIDPGQLLHIRKDLADKRWNVVSHDVPCAPTAETFVDIRVRGVAVWQQHSCDSEDLPAESKRAIDAVRVLVEKATAPHTPPCCKN